MESKKNNITNWFLTSNVLASIRKGVHNVLASKNVVVIGYVEPERSPVISLIKRIKTENEMLLGYNEAYQIHMAVKATAKIEGDIAEVGSYRGGSAKIIGEAKGDKTLHLFDTFEGLPELTKEDNKNQFFKGQFFAPLDKVKDYLKAYKNIHFYKGLFPDTSDPVKDKKFSFVHLDVDLYEPTAKSLEFFYPRLSRGGIIISHDYINAPGVRKAFDEFFADKPEPLIEMSGTQCLVVKI